MPVSERLIGGAAMLNLGKVFGPDGWGPLVLQVRKGEDPHLVDLATALRGAQHVPPEVRIYLAEYLEGKRKRKRGRKPFDAGTRAMKWFRQNSLADRVQRWKRVFEKRYGKCNAYREALATVAAERGISENTLDKYCYPRKSRR